MGSEKISRIMCNTRTHARSSKQAHNISKPDYEYAAVYAIECCSSGDFCNDGAFPELPSAHHEGILNYFSIIKSVELPEVKHLYFYLEQRWPLKWIPKHYTLYWVYLAQ